jgi:hypothetical protein
LISEHTKLFRGDAAALAMNGKRRESCMMKSSLDGQMENEIKGSDLALLYMNTPAQSQDCFPFLMAVSALLFGLAEPCG